MARTVARQVDLNVLGSGLDKELRRTKEQAGALIPDAAGLVSMFEPKEGGEIIHGLMAEQEVTRNRASYLKSRPGSGARACCVPCGMVVGVLAHVDGGDDDGVR